ncbi:MAG: helix-turn-helix domain-containing protein [Xanthomonadales bacterium]|nr:helix-turn-helix domain-containing protein [Xanthomonadales bacterium]
MYVDTHAQARTTPAMREAIQQATGSVAELARRFGVSEQTIRKWRRRDGVADHSHRPERLRTTLDGVQEDLLVGLRVGLRLPLDGLLQLARSQLNPAVSRSAIDRTLRRRGVSRLDLLRPALPAAPIDATLLLSLVPIRSPAHGLSRLLVARRWPDAKVAITHLPPRWRDLWVWLLPLLAVAAEAPLRLLAGDDVDWSLPRPLRHPSDRHPLPSSQQQALWLALQTQCELLAQEQPGRVTVDGNTPPHRHLDHQALLGLGSHCERMLVAGAPRRNLKPALQPPR